LNKKETHLTTLHIGYALTVNGLLRHYKPQIDIDVTTKIRKTMGKGSTPRKFSVTNEEYANRWNAIFGKDNDSQENKEKALESGESDISCPSGGIDNPEGQAGQTQTP
jgi:hypothetical protein